MAFIKGVYRINGAERTVIADENESVSDVLRRIGLTGVKVGCGKGMCGACTVIINGELVRSCIKKWKALPELSSIETIEGLGTASNPHPLQLSWVKHGAIQCGFCTPGFIMSAKNLLDKNPSPTRNEVRDWFTKNKNLCRCTGYKQLVDAVMDAAEVMRGEKPLKTLKLGNGDIYDKTYNGRYPRPTALGKALGLVDYGRDMSEKMPEGTLRLALKFADIPHGIIKSIDTSEAEIMPGVERVITAKDIPGTNDLGAFNSHKRTLAKNSKVVLLAEGKVRRIGDPVVLVAADTEEHARAAAAKIKVDYEALPDYQNAIEAALGDVSVNGDGTPNLFVEFPLIKGEDTQKFFDEAAKSDSDFVAVKGDFYTTPEPHLALEPVHAQAYFDEDGVLTMHYKDQAPHLNVPKLAAALGLPKEKIRNVMNGAGASFGYSMIPQPSGLAGLATLLTGKPCSLDLTYAETQRFTGKRSKCYFKGGVVANKKTGKMVAMDLHALVDCGSQIWKGPDLALKITSFIGVHYNIPNLRGIMSAGFSNASYCVQYRGYGSPQIYTATESLIDMMARKLGIDPFEFRAQNIVHEGDTQPNGWRYNKYSHEKLMSMLSPAYKEALEWKMQAPAGVKRGVGLAFGGYHVSYPGGDHSDVELRIEPDGMFTFALGWPEMGQCADVGAYGIICHALEPYGVGPERVQLYMDDTKLVPETGAAAGSRSHYVVSAAAVDAVSQMMKFMSNADGSLKSYQELVDAGLPTSVIGKYRESDSVVWNEDTGCGKLPVDMNYSFYCITAEVDEATGKTKIDKVDISADIGIVGNFNSTDGQAFGGTMHEIGYALREDYNDHEKKYETLLGCGFTQCNDMPDDVNIQYYENAREQNPMGAGGASEGFQSAAHCAVLNAIYDATGVRVYELPATPEKVLAGMKLVAEGKEVPSPDYNWGVELHSELEYLAAHPVSHQEGAYDIDSV